MIILCGNFPCVSREPKPFLISKFLLSKMVLIFRSHALQQHGQLDKVMFRLLMGHENFQHPTFHVGRPHCATKPRVQVPQRLHSDDFLWTALYSLKVTSCGLLTSSSQQAARVLNNVVPTLQMRRLRPRARMWFPRGHPGLGFQILSQRSLL